MAALVAACAGDATRVDVTPPPAVPTPDPVAIRHEAADQVLTPTQQLQADSTVTTPSGATLTVAKGWWVTKDKDSLTLEDPDRSLRTVLLEVAEREPIKAASLAWQHVKPDFALKVHDSMSPPPIRGWDAVTEIQYETKAAEHRGCTAMVRRHGNTQYVALTAGPAAAFDKREAQLTTALWTLKPQGMEEESFRDRTPHELDGAKQKELDAFIEDARNKLGVPGAAVAVVQGGKVAYEKGFGVRTVGKKESVTPNTLFLIGSITKSMTTFLMATLVDEGKLGWDTPVTKVLPAFALGDEATTKQVTMANTVCACTGMPRRDMQFLFEYDKVTPEQRIAEMKTWKPSTGFGETFQYSNMMVAAGGFAAGHALDPKALLGPGYDAAMRSHVFGPMGMKATTLDFRAAERAEHASPHAENIEGDVRAIPLAEETMLLSARPAGGVWSNLRDMERYVLTDLANGVTPEGKRVASEANLLERRKPRVRVNDVESYGLGLVVGTYRDTPVFWHNGGTTGFGALMFDLPEKKLGIVVLTNVNTDEVDTFYSAVQRKVAELTLDGKDLAGPRVEFRVKRKAERIAKRLEKVNKSPDPAWLAKLAGTYTNPNLGAVHITVDAKGGRLDAGEWKSAFAQKREDDGTLKAILVEPPMTGTELEVGGDDAHPTLTLVDAQEKYPFARQGK